jgi:hypothetical protein
MAIHFLSFSLRLTDARVGDILQPVHEMGHKDRVDRFPEVRPVALDSSLSQLADALALLEVNGGNAA